MAFNKDINSIFDKYVSSILEAVKPTEQDDGKDKFTRMAEELDKLDKQFPNQGYAQMAQQKREQAKTATPAATPAATPSATPAATPATTPPANRGEAAAMRERGELKPSTPAAGASPEEEYNKLLGRTPGPFDADNFNNIDKMGNDKNNPQAAAFKKQVTGGGTAPAAPAAATPASGRDEKTVQAELDAAIKSGDQTKAGNLFNELGEVRKATGAPNQPVDLLKKNPVAGDASASTPGAPIQQPVAGTAQKAGVYTPEQLAAFQKTHGTSFDPNSRVDRQKMMQVAGGSKPASTTPAVGSATPTTASGALPGAGNKPGELKRGQLQNIDYSQVEPRVRKATAVNPTPRPVANSSMGGAPGAASNVAGKVGDTIENLFKGQLGKGAQPRPKA